MQTLQVLLSPGLYLDILVHSSEKTPFVKTFRNRSFFLFKVNDPFEKLAMCKRGKSTQTYVHQWLFNWNTKINITFQTVLPASKLGFIVDG